MNNDYRSSDFKEWLDKLQRESWQLELIISGFAIYGLVLAYDPIILKRNTSFILEHIEFGILWTMTLACWYILIFNLILHVLLRGLWIGAIGLRYVSGDIDYSKLNYSEKFNTYLKRKVGSFDRYIARLENYCSVLFGISFLLIFYVIGFFSFIFLIAVVQNLLSQLGFIPKNALSFIKPAFSFIMLIAAIIVFIDFIGQGFLKKRKWTSKLYFPIYWFFSKVTFSFLYRPLAYNFLDNKFGKKLSLLLVPIYIVITLLSTMTYVNSNYIYSLSESSKYHAEKTNYEDESTKESEFVDFASIPSKVITTPYLNVFLVYSEMKEDFVFEKNTDLKPLKDLRGFSHGIIEGFNDVKTENLEDSEIKLGEYLKTVNDMYSLKIDSVRFKSDFIISTNAKDRTGFETYLNIKTLSTGKHYLTIDGPTRERSHEDSEIVEKVLVTIPFWYYPENAFTPSNISHIEKDSRISK